jgi:hypothetical protein
MKNIKILLLLMLAGMFVVGGCGTAISEGVGVAKGPQGHYYQVKDVPPLDGYTNFEVGAITDSFGGAPAQLLSLLPGDITQALREAEIPVNGSGKTAIITGKILFYEKPGTFGKVEQAITDFDIVDKSSGRILGRAYCVGRSNSYIANRGIPDKAKAVANGIAKWIKDNRKYSEKK